MAMEKVSLTLDRKAVAAARKQVGARGLSSYVDSALKLKLQHDRIADLLDELDREHGPVSPQAIRRVEREWPLERKLPKKRPRG